MGTRPVGGGTSREWPEAGALLLQCCIPAEEYQGDEPVSNRDL